MSGDVQPRKRNKDNKRNKKKEPSLSEIHLQKSAKQDDDLDFDDTNIHVQKEIKFGGNALSKVFFSLVFGALICMVGVIVFEHRGTGNEVLSRADSPWSRMLEGWLEDKADNHDDHHVAHHDDHDEEDDHDHSEAASEETDDHDEELDDHPDEEEHDDDDHDNEEHDDDNHDNEDHDNHSEEQADDAEESDGYFSRFISTYVRSSEGDENVDQPDEVDEALEEESSVFGGFIKKYIYSMDAAKDEGYDSQADEQDEHGEIDERDEDVDTDDGDDETSDDENDETPDVDDNETPEIERRRYRRHSSYRFEKDDDEDEGIGNGDKDDDNDDKDDDNDDKDDDHDDSNEVDKDDDVEERVVKDWRKIVYRAPAHREEEDEEREDDSPYRSQSPETELSEPEDKNDSEERDAGNDVEDEENLDEVNDEDDERKPDENDEEEDKEPALEESEKGSDDGEEEGAGIAVKFSVGVALIVVAHVVLVKKWKTDPDVPTPSAPQPPPAYIEPVAPLEEIDEETPPPSYADRRLTLVDPREEIQSLSDGEDLPPSDGEESELGEYEEELSGSEGEIKPSTLVTYEYSPVDTEQEEEEEDRSENDIIAPINDKWATVTRPTPQLDSENEELVNTEDEIEYSDNELSPPPSPKPQARYGGPQSGEEDYLLADITNTEDWGIRHELDAAEAMYNGSESSI